MRRRVVAVLFVIGAIGALAVSSPATAAEPADGTVSMSSPTVEWEGDAFAGTYPVTPCSAPEVDPTCDVFTLTVDPAGAGFLDVHIEAVAGGDDFDLFVYDEAGEEVASSVTVGSQENVTIEAPAAGTYSVEVFGLLVAPGGSYAGRATLRAAEAPAPTGGGPDSVLWDRTGEEVQASVEVPLRVVAVGFEPGSLDEDAVLGEVPDRQQVGVLNTYGGGFRNGDQSHLQGLDTLVNHGRVYYAENEPPLLPLEMRWKPELVYASSEFTDALFAEMTGETSSTGVPSGQTHLAYLEAYNATRGVHRVAAGGEPVLPGAEAFYVDGENTEDWIAQHSESLLGFPAGKEVGDAGYTVFLLNTWDSPEALEHFPADQYHYFKVDRPDPDTDEYTGIDWARVWGGRYRFMMIDLGAGPNPYEAETWGNRNRSVNGSAAYDPPLWEYRANAPRPVTLVNLADGTEQAVSPGETWDQEQLELMIGRTVNQAISFRFFHSYLYEPRPGTGRFWLSDNVWHDAKATVPWTSDLTLLYDQERALAGLRSLLPYFEFEGDVVFQYLEDSAEHPEYVEDQAALDDAKMDGDDIAGAPHLSMHTETMMDYIDSKPDRFLRGGPCFTNVPTIQVVVPAHYAWALPIAAGIATNRDGVPWGFLNSINDVTKWSGADRDQTLALLHPQPLGGGAFTYTTIHEASHYLGLAHPHDTVGATRNEDGSPRYYDGFTWTYNSTAAPTTYSHAELTYNVLDQESVARGHMAYYLSWTDEALHEAGTTFHAAGKTTTASLPAQAQLLRSQAIAASAKAEQLYASFDFVGATFAAKEAWKAAAQLHDLATGSPAGTAELAKGTQQVTGRDAALCAAGADVAAGGAAPAPAPTGTLPKTGGGAGAPVELFAVLVAGGVALALRRRFG